MGKRYYHPNREVTAQGFKLSITSNGTVYWTNSGGGYRKLESLWQPKVSVLSVQLPNGEEANLAVDKDGIKEILKKGEEDAKTENPDQ